MRWEWHSLDHIGAAESEVEMPTDATPWDYFHLNSIDLGGAGTNSPGNMLISARSTWAGYQLEGGAGKVLWRLGGNKSSFKMGPGTRMAWQHDGRVLSDGELTFFDDGSNPPIHHQSRAVRISARPRGPRSAPCVRLHARQPAAAGLEPGQHADAARTATRSSATAGCPRSASTRKDGSLLFDAHQPYDMSFYRAFRFPWSGRPLSPPAVLASLNNTGEETIVHASWNGATERGLLARARRARPRLAGGAGDDPGRVVSRARRRCPQKYAYVAVQALDAAGHVLGSSPTVRVISFSASLTTRGGRRAQ